MYLQDRPWRISYASNENNPIADFYIPALECAVQYDRSWLIKYEYLDIKIAVPMLSKQDACITKQEIPVESDRTLDPQHIFHEKVGIFTDIKGDRLAFSGSNNESLSGWSNNVESFHVYCSWEGDRDLERVNEEAYRFYSVH